jgi:DNA polymerase (family 10)
VRKKFPRELRKLLGVSGLGPKRVKVLHDALQIETVEDLKRAVDAGALAKIPGLGGTLEKKLKDALKHVGQGVALPDGRFPLAVAQNIAADFTGRLSAMSGVQRVEAAGSLRRRKATVGDLDILVCADHARRGAVIDDFSKFPGVVEVLANGSTRGSVKLDIGLQVDLRVVELDEYGAALLYFTGNKNHSIELRAAAIKLGFKLNEYGVWRGDERIAGETEESMYAALGWQYLPPEKRER